MVFAVESWTVPTEGDEEPCDTEMVVAREFASEGEAMRWAWERMEEGFFTRMFRR